MTAIEQRSIATNDTVLNVAVAGAGPAILLMHGWPHNWRLWETVIPPLVAAGYQVVAPDMRGLGGSRREQSGYDLTTLSGDMIGLVDALGLEDVSLGAIDLSVPIAFMTAVRWPKRVRRLTMSESLLGNLPGAEAFLAAGAPWWFGFHSVPGLAERSVVGNEEEYIGWFLRNMTFEKRGIDPAIAAAFIDAYRGVDALRCGFDYYRALPGQSTAIAHAVDPVPELPPAQVLVGGFVKDALFKQMAGIAGGTKRVDVPDTGHLVPLENPSVTASALIDFETAVAAPGKQAAT